MNRIRGLYQKRGFYYWQPPQPNGIKVPAVALRTKNRVEAILAYEKAKTAHELGVAEFKGSISEAIQIYVEARKSETAPSTNKRARQKLPAFAEEINQLVHKTKLSSITKKDILTWKASLAERMGYNGSKLDGSTVNTYLTMLKAFFNWCVDEGFISSSPMEKVKIPKPSKQRPIRFLTREQGRLLLENAPNEDYALILNLGLFAGLRFGEINAIKSDWITYSDDGKRAMITVQAEEGVWNPKDKHLRQIPIPPALINFLRPYKDKDGYLFSPYKKHWGEKYRTNPKKGFKAYMEKQGFGFVTYHVLRKSFATQLHMSGVSIGKIAKLLGDDERTTLKHYIGFVPVEEDVTHCLG
ncbi:MAG: tyrosine-type recombinase/integrase [Akkermansiaceae bacterium]